MYIMSASLIHVRLLQKPVLTFSGKCLAGQTHPLHLCRFPLWTYSNVLQARPGRKSLSRCMACWAHLGTGRYEAYPSRECQRH